MSDIQSLKNLIPLVDGYPRPDWQAIDQLVGEVSEHEVDKEYCKAVTLWVDLLAQHLSEPYQTAQTDNFAILTGLSARQNELLKPFIERARAEILDRLAGIASDNYLGKHTVLIFDSHDDYYQYVMFFYQQDGEYPLSSGMFLNRDFGHIALPFCDVSETEATIAHEFTHASLAHLPIPLWLNEGLAVTMENDLCGTQPLAMNDERFGEHVSFWNAATIQEFWTGQSFGRTDVGVDLSYELSRYCIKALAGDFDRFAKFANAASFEDGGEAAAMAMFGGSLGGLIEQFFGAGDWSPDPAVFRAPDNAQS